MVNGKNYLNSSLIFLFFITASPVFSAEFGYTPIGDLPIESIKSSFVDNVDKPTIALAAAVVLGGSALFWGRHEISKLAEEQCVTLEKNATEMLNGPQANKIPWTPPFLIKLCVIKVKQSLLAPLCGNISDYLSYNQYHLPAAAIFYALGHYFKFPMMGGGFGGATLFAGYVGVGAKKNHAENMERHTETQKQVAGVKAEVVKQGEELSGKIDASKQEVINQVNEKTAALSTEIAEVQKSIAALGSQVGEDVEKVAKEVKALGGKLESVPNQIILLSGQLDELRKENLEKNRQTIEAIQQLNTTNAQFVETKKSVELLANGLMEKIAILSSTTINQIDEMKNQIAGQNKEIGNTNTKMSELVLSVTSRNGLLESLEQLQIKNGTQLVALDEKIRHVAEGNTVTLNSMKVMAEAYEESTQNFATRMSSLEASQRQVEESINSFFVAVTNRVSAVEATNQEILKELREQKERSDRLERALEKSRAENAENTLKLHKAVEGADKRFQEELLHIKKQNKQTHNMLSQGSFSSPHVATIQQSSSGNSSYPENSTLSFGHNRKSLPFGTPTQDDSSYPVGENSYSPVIEQIISRKRKQVEAPKAPLAFGKSSGKFKEKVLNKLTYPQHNTDESTPMCLIFIIINLMYYEII